MEPGEACRAGFQSFRLKKWVGWLWFIGYLPPEML